MTTYTQLAWTDAPCPKKFAREVCSTDQPIQRLKRVGIESLSDAETLAILIAGNATAADIDTAHTLLSHFGGFLGIQRAGLHDLADVPGMTMLKATRLHAALDLARRTEQERIPDRLQIMSPVDAAHLLQTAIGDKDQEHLVVLCLDTKNRLMGGVHTIYIGSLNSALVRIGEVFRPAIRLNSAAIVVSHNHPSQDCTPSPEDLLLTRQLVDAGKLVDIDLLDHLIVSATGFVSLRELGFK